MRHAHTVDQVRAAEGVLLEALPEGALMQRAAGGLATAIAQFLGRVYSARVLVLVGAGNNGGDALFAGAILARRGAVVEAVRLSEQCHAGGLAALLAAGGRQVDLAQARRPDIVVDGILGIGGRGGLRPDAAAAAERFPDAPVVAVDVPSGVDVDTGGLDGPHVSAALTVTFGTLKTCHLVDPAAQACGTVELVDIGLDLAPAPLTALQAADVAAMIRVPARFDQKYSRGVVGVRAGSAQYPGAAVLSTAGAGQGLAGMVRYVGSAAEQVRAAHPDVVVGEGRVQAWVVGSGGSEDADAALAAALDDDVPTVVDADALIHLERGTRNVVLTPHAGELARILGVERTEIEARQLHFVRRAAQEYAATVLLKGRRTLIAVPGGDVRVTTTGVPWLGVAGAGDVLGGLIGALLASGLSPFDAASAGSWLHGAAATLASGGGPVTATEVARAVPRVVRDLLA